MLLLPPHLHTWMHRDCTQRAAQSPRGDPAGSPPSQIPWPQALRIPRDQEDPSSIKVNGGGVRSMIATVSLSSRSPHRLHSERPTLFHTPSTFPRPFRMPKTFIPRPVHLGAYQGYCILWCVYPFYSARRFTNSPLIATTCCPPSSPQRLTAAQNPQMVKIQVHNQTQSIIRLQSESSNPIQ